MFTTRTILQRFVQRLPQRRSNRRSAWRKSSSLSTLFAVAAAGTSTYVWTRGKLNLREVHSAEQASQNQGKKFEGKNVLITGAAGDLGSTTARAFSEQGARIVLCDLACTEPKLKQLTKELLSLGSPAVIYASVDVTNVDDVKKSVELAVKEFGGIDILFNNAGISCGADSVDETDEACFRKVQDVNVYGVFLMMKYVSNHMIESGKGGVIVNMSSAAGLVTSRLFFSYFASKFAVSGMTRAASKSLAQHNIRVNALAPYLLEGSMADFSSEQLAGKVYGSVSEETIKEIRATSSRNNPMGRYGKMREVAEVVLFLSSEEASYINGVVLPVDGGFVA